MFQIELENISFSYEDSKIILKNINLSISQCDFVLITGDNGAGKSTLLKIIAGILKPRSGYVRINGNPIDEDKDYFQKIGFVMQYAEDSFCCDTVFDEIAFASKNFELDKIEKRVMNAITLTGIDEKLLHKSPFELSNGEARRVAIASVIAHEPFLLILDEPFVGLDKHGKQCLAAILKRWKDIQRSVIVVSHQTKYLINLANKIFRLEEGVLSVVDSL